MGLYLFSVGLHGEDEVRMGCRSRARATGRLSAKSPRNLDMIKGSN